MSSPRPARRRAGAGTRLALVLAGTVTCLACEGPQPRGAANLADSRSSPDTARAVASSRVRRFLHPLEWFGTLNVFGSVPSMEVGSRVGMTATIWNGGASLPLEVEPFRASVAYAHARGWRHVAGLSALNLRPSFLSYRPELAEAMRLTIDGENPRAEWVHDAPCTADTNHPYWRAFLKEVVHRNIDCGSDGILVDDVMGPFVWDRAIFNPATLAVIRAYFRARFGEDELASRFGIADIDAFDLGEHLRDHGLVETWNVEPWRLPFYDELVLCLVEASRGFIDELVQDGKQYARTAHGRDVAFTANVSDLNPALLPSSNALDFLTIEYHHDFHGGFPPAGRATVSLALARAVNPRPAVLTIGTNTAAAMSQMPTTDTLIQQMIAETYAAGGALFVPPVYAWSPETGPGTYTASTAAMAPQYRFVLANRSLYEAVRSTPDVAVVYSLPSAVLRWGEHLDSFYGTSLALLDGHTPYSTVVSGRQGLLDRRLTVEALRAYGTVVLPGVPCLSDAEIDVLEQYCAEGGRVVAWGPLGRENEDGATVTRPALASLLTPGNHAVGEGVVVYEAEDLGRAYQLTRASADRERILRLLPPPPPTTAPATVNAFRWLDAPGTASIVHLVNNDYDLAHDAITPSPPFELALVPATNPGAGDTQVYFLSAETAPQLLPFSVVQGNVTVTVPAIGIHGTVAAIPRGVAQSQAAAAIAPVLRDLAVARRRGEVTAETQAVVDAIDEALAAGNYLLARDLARRLAELLAPLLRPRVLFDEAHQERNTMSWERALRLAPSLTDGHPYWLYFGGYLEATRDELVIDVNENGEIADELLAPYDVLVLAVPLAHSIDGHPFAAAEKGAIARFVTRGGGLLVLGDAGVNPAVNELVLPFGIELDSRAVYSAHPSGGPGDFTVRDIEPSAVSSPYEWYVMNWGASLRVRGDALALATTDRDTWQVVDGDEKQDPGEPSGPFAVLATSRSGRVVCLADNNFHHDPAWGAGSANWPFLTRVLRGLAATLTTP